jgi:hypothetical protein
VKIFSQILFSILFFIPTILISQTAQQEFHSTVVAVYNFYPHNLDSKQIDEKSGELDKFWENMKSNKTTLLPFLRMELSDLSNNSFFLYDGSKLLLSISSDRSDKLIALEAISKVDIRDVQNTDYLYTVHNFSKEGFNTTAAALRILNYPKFSAYVVQHALQVDQELALLFMLLPISDQLYVGSAIEHLSSEKSDTSAKSLLNLLWYSVTEIGDSAIAACAKDLNHPANVRDYANELQARNKSFSSSLFTLFSSSDLGSLKEERSKIMWRVSDEALYDLKDITKKIRVAYCKKR